MKTGRIKSNGVVLRSHEYETVVFLLELGYDIELILKSNKPGERSADLWMEGAAWEMKASTGEGKYLIANTFQRAVRQSSNIIIDLRRTKRHQTKCLAEIKKEFKHSKSVQKVKIIMKGKKMLEMCR